MKRRWPLALGAILLVLGGWLHFARPSVPQETELLRVGSWRATVEGRRQLPGWVAPFVLGAGAGIVLLGLLQRR
jgi:hypothetical protein